MNDHYFTNKPKTSHDVKTIEFTIRNQKLKFYTDAGVFSKQRVDYGSEIMLKALPPLEGQVLDLGCGYGALGITLAKLNPQAAITMVDINERAVKLARRNMKLNNVDNAQSLISDGLSKVTGTYNYIISNPPIRAGKKVIYPWFEKSKDFLEPGGWLCLVIQKKQGAKSAMDKLQEVFGNCEALDKTGGFWIIRSIK